MVAVLLDTLIPYFNLLPYFTLSLSAAHVYSITLYFLASLPFIQLGVYGCTNGWILEI